MNNLRNLYLQEVFGHKQSFHFVELLDNINRVKKLLKSDVD